MLLTPDEWTTQNNTEQHYSDNIYIKHVSSILLTLVLPCCNNHCLFIKREQCFCTMLLTTVAWTTLFSHDNNIVQALFNEQRRTTCSIFTRVISVPFQNKNRLNIGRQISLAIYIRYISWYYRIREFDWCWWRRNDVITSCRITRSCSSACSCPSIIL
jgi:hypothetical protein